MADYNMQMDYSGLSVPKRRKPLVAQNKPQQEPAGGNQQAKLAAASDALKLAGSMGDESGAMSVGQGALSGALTGSALYAAFAPAATTAGTAGAAGAAGTATGGAALGAGAATGIGLAVGAGLAYAQARAAKKQRERDAESGHYQRLAAIEEQKAQRMQNAMAQMAANMGASLRR